MVIHAEPANLNSTEFWPSKSCGLNFANSQLKSSIAQRKVPAGHTKFYKPSERNGACTQNY